MGLKYPKEPVNKRKNGIRKACFIRSLGRATCVQCYTGTINIMNAWRHTIYLVDARTGQFQRKKD